MFTFNDLNFPLTVDDDSSPLRCQSNTNHFIGEVYDLHETNRAFRLVWACFKSQFVQFQLMPNANRLSKTPKSGLDAIQKNCPNRFQDQAKPDSNHQCIVKFEISNPVSLRQSNSYSNQMFQDPVLRQFGFNSIIQFRFIPKYSKLQIRFNPSSFTIA